MKIVFLTYGTSPIPATQGGAVENLIEDLLDKNEEYHSLDITVYSVYEKKAARKAKAYNNTDFQFVKCPVIIKWADKIIYAVAKYILRKENLISYRFILQRAFVMAHYPKMLLKENFDRVVLVTNSTLFLVLKNKKVFSKYKNKIVYYLHNEVRSLFLCKNEIASIRSLVGVSEFVNQAFLQKMPSLNSDNCYILKNCIDTSAFGVRNPRKEKAFRKKFQLAEKDFVVVFAGRLIREKGSLETLKAVKKCGRKNLKLLIVGSGFYSSDVTDSYSTELQKEANEISDRIVFTGYINYSDMPSIYSICDIAVLPSLWDEPAGMTMVEAAASGLPLITTDSGGIPEYIPNEAAIILTKNDNLINNIASSICLLMDHADLYWKLSKEGEKLKDTLNLDNYYKNFNEIIKK